MFFFLLSSPFAEVKEIRFSTLGVMTGSKFDLVGTLKIKEKCGFYNLSIG